MKNTRTKKVCKHTATFGEVGGKTHFCLDCNQNIPNPYYEEEMKELAHAKKHPGSRSPVATALRRMKEFLKDPAKHSVPFTLPSKPKKTKK
jgi:hypothetical protein